MSTGLSPQDALARVPGLARKGWHIVALDGGLTNRNYLASHNGVRLVVRLDDVHTAGFRIDRDIEIAARRQAAAAGFAADVLFSDVGAGILVSRYVDGRVWQPRDLQLVQNLEALAIVIRGIHRLPALGAAFDPRRAVRAYIEAIEDQPGLLSFGRHCRELIDAGPALRGPVFSHNDVVAENIVSSDGIMLLDWEYAADNDPMFDFASLAGYHDLQDWQVDVLLSAYTGGAIAECRERLLVQQRLFDALQWLWIAARHSMSPKTRLAKRLEELKERIR